MLKTLYIFPHPDDESFGPAPLIYRQTRRGEEVHLLTLTKGEATKMRFKYGYSKEEMGQVRLAEMNKVNDFLQFTSMEVLNLADGELGQMNLLELEGIVRDHIEKIQPNIIVTYPVHGISGHPDHLTIHFVVKQLFLELKQNADNNWLKRLAFLTFPTPEDSDKDGAHAHVRTSKMKDIDCIIQLNRDEKDALRTALNCYDTYIDVINSTGVIDHIGDQLHFEFYGEEFEPKVSDITSSLKD